jgi:hypothetical protein
MGLRLMPRVSVTNSRVENNDEVNNNRRPVRASISSPNGSGIFDGKRRTGFAFDDPHHEGYHALQARVQIHNVARAQKRPSLDDSRLTPHINNLHSASTKISQHFISHAAMVLYPPTGATRHAFPRSHTAPRTLPKGVQLFD